MTPEDPSGGSAGSVATDERGPTAGVEEEAEAEAKGLLVFAGDVFAMFAVAVDVVAVVCSLPPVSLAMLTLRLCCRLCCCSSRRRRLTREWRSLPASFASSLMGS